MKEEKLAKEIKKRLRYHQSIFRKVIGTRLDSVEGSNWIILTLKWVLEDKSKLGPENEINIWK